MAVSDGLNDEERTIMVFLKRYFDSAGMPNALWILNESENIWDCEPFFSLTVSFIRATEDSDELDITTPIKCFGR